MGTSSNLRSLNPRLLNPWLGVSALARFGVVGIVGVFLGAAPVLPAAQVRVPEGTLVRIKLLYSVTTENVAKGDRIHFDVAEDVEVGGQVVILRGATAWGRVIEVKGAGKKDAKDASVTFGLVAVNAVDKTQVPLRIAPSKPRMPDSHDNEVEVSTLIPGLPERRVGAERGRNFAAYTDAAVLVTVPDAAPKSPAGPGATQAGSQAGPSAASLPAETAAPPIQLPPEEAFVDFNSMPPGADVLIDGAFRGNTPLRLQVSPGRHMIEIRLVGHRPWLRRMVVGPGSKPSVRATLEKD